MKKKTKKGKIKLKLYLQLSILYNRDRVKHKENTWVQWFGMASNKRLRVR